MIEHVADGVRVRRVGPIHGAGRPPGSKSLTNRRLLIAALADGTTRLSDASLSDDAHAMIAGLRALGVRVDVYEASSRIDVVGCRGQLPESSATLNVGTAGTAMRFLTALVCLGGGRYRVDGAQRMRERPIGDLVDALRELGAGIEYDGNEGYPPITVVANGLSGGEVLLHQPPSSQFISALLLVAPYAVRDTLIAIEGAYPSQPYVEMTLQLQRESGVETLVGPGPAAGRFIVPAFQRYHAGDYSIEPDASAATYFWAAAAIAGGSATVLGLTRSSRQGDVAFVDVLARMGCVVSEAAQGVTVARNAGATLKGIDVDLNAMPDTAQTLAVVALFASGATRIRGVANLRVKETDRLAALRQELTKLGAEVALHDDGLTIAPSRALAPSAEIDTYEDHRMAMSFALVGLGGVDLLIRGAQCVSKSFPGYFEALRDFVNPGDGDLI